MALGTGCGDGDSPSEDDGGTPSISSDSGSGALAECLAEAQDEADECACENCLDEIGACVDDEECGAMLDCVNETGCDPAPGSGDCDSVCETWNAANEQYGTLVSCVFSNSCL